MRAGGSVSFRRTVRRGATSIWLVWAAASLAQTTSRSAGAAGQPQMVGVRTRLETALNSRTAVEGMPVEARPEVKMHLADGMDLDRSSRLVGKIGAVKASVAGSDSMVSVIFDKVRLKDGREIPVKATILWVGPAPGLMNPTVVSAPADRTTPGVGVEAGGSQVPPAQGFAGSEITGLPQRNEDGSNKRGALAPGVAAQWGAIGKVNFFSEIARNESGFFRTAKGNVSVPGGSVLAFALVVLAPTAHP
jgi:hypothetical protein